MLDVDHHLVHGQVKALCHGLDDTDVGLMRHNEADVVLVQSVALGYQCAVVAHARYGVTEHRASLLIEVMQTVVYAEV